MGPIITLLNDVKTVLTTALPTALGGVLATCVTVAIVRNILGRM